MKPGQSPFFKWSTTFALAALGWLWLIPTGVGQEVMPRLAEVGPWPVVSRLVGYGDRLWLANSVKGRNHNSADVYSFDPLRGELRYERHLFSQDAGRPLVANGLLYWPFEDGRVSLGWGDFMVTDGERWRLGTVPSAEIFHVHAMAQVGGRLVAATSAWRAGLQVSTDGDRSWQALYDHPMPERRVSRITELIEVNGRALAYLTSRDQQRVLVLDGDTVAELAGWPKEAPLLGWARRGSWVYGLVEAEDGTAVWRSDGMAVEQVAPARNGWRPRALAAGEGALWAVTSEGAGGFVWRSGDGRTWERFRAIQGGRPSDLVLHDGWLYVGGAGDDGSGALWGERLGPTLARASAAPAQLNDAPRHSDEAGPRALADRLGRALAEPESFRDYGEALRDLVLDFARQTPAPETWAPLLDRATDNQWPAVSQSHYSDGSAIGAEMLGRWILLWGMSLAGTGVVPVDWLNEAWTAPANRAEKYYATAPAAIWTAGEIGQDDAATIDALVARLDRQDDPLWLTGDVVGALAALTGQRFAYARAAWRNWWEKARAEWPTMAKSSQ